jgi:carbon monoxide dehydrogenase subunit G
MAQVAASVQVDSGLEAVWALMCDPHRYPEIADPTERMIEVPDREMGVGYVYKEYGGIKPFLGESEWRVTEFEPMRRLVHIGDDGSMTMNLEIELTPTDGGTRLTQTFSLTPRWYLVPVSAILWPLFMRKRAQEAADKTVANIKRILE